jgi:hypothetical protein
MENVHNRTGRNSYIVPLVKPIRHHIRNPSIAQRMDGHRVQNTQNMILQPHTFLSEIKRIILLVEWFFSNSLHVFRHDSFVEIPQLVLYHLAFLLPYDIHEGVLPEIPTSDRRL